MIVLLCGIALVLGVPMVPAAAAAHDPGERADIIVAADGSGDHRSIQEALDAVQDVSPTPVMILIRPGLYQEKLFIRRSHVTLVGEDRERTRIVSAVLREEWNARHGGSDWGSAVVNIDTGTTDVTLANLTVVNNHGSLYGTYRKHQFAVRGAGTRVMLLHCTIVSDGGDALSLWDRTDGMYYHAGCHFEGWVDYVCPRGWCYVTGCTFFGHNRPSASIWHDGSSDSTQKFVITDSFFDGVSGFPLGRNHLDAQIYLIRCRFSANMADRPFYRPPSSPRPWRWGARHYFSGCHRDGGDYAWFRDNLYEAAGSPSPGDVTARWAFDGKWDPEASMPSVLPGAFLPRPAQGSRAVPAGGIALAWVAGRNARSHQIFFGTDSLPPLVARQQEASFRPGVLRPGTTYFWRVDETTASGTVPGELWTFTTAGVSAQ